MHHRAAAAAAAAAIYKIDDHRVCRSGQTRSEGSRRTMDGGWMEVVGGRRLCCSREKNKQRAQKNQENKTLKIIK